MDAKYKNLAAPVDAPSTTQPSVEMGCQLILPVNMVFLYLTEIIIHCFDSMLPPTGYRLQLSRPFTEMSNFGLLSFVSTKQDIIIQHYTYHIQRAERSVWNKKINIFWSCISAPSPAINYYVIGPMGCMYGRGENKGRLNNLIMDAIIKPDCRNQIEFVFFFFWRA